MSLFVCLLKITFQDLHYDAQHVADSVLGKKFSPAVILVGALFFSEYHYQYAYWFWYSIGKWKIPMLHRHFYLLNVSYVMFFFHNMPIIILKPTSLWVFEHFRDIF